MSDTPTPVGGLASLLGGDTVGNPELARAYLDRHRASIAGREGKINETMDSQKANIEQMSRLLDETTQALKASRQGRSNLPLIALGAGMMSSTGNFGQAVGEGLRMMVPTIAADRQDEEDFQSKLSDIGMRKATIANAPLESQLSYLKALQVGDINAMRDIEKAQIRTAGGAGAGQDPAIVKEFRVWQKIPGNESKTLQDYQEFKSRLGSDRNTPAALRELDAVNKVREAEGKPPITLEDWIRQKSSAGAQGKTQGTVSAEADDSLPGLINNAEVMAQSINTIKSHPGLPKAVGLFSPLPDVPGGDSADFNAELDKLKGQAFLQMFSQLRGGGAITEMEGKKATDALAALSTRQSPEQFKKNLDEINNILAKGISVARQRANREPRRTEAPMPGKTGEESKPQGTVKEGTIIMNPQTKEKKIFRGGVWEKFGG